MDIDILEQVYNKLEKNIKGNSNNNDENIIKIIEKDKNLQTYKPSLEEMNLLKRKR